MKKSSLFAASVAAASATAISSSSSSSKIQPSHLQDDRTGEKSAKSPFWKNSSSASASAAPPSSEKFAPRFDGLRFIETLVTAHR